MSVGYLLTTASTTSCAGSSGPPGGVGVTFLTGSFSYNCNSGSPAALVKSGPGNGTIKFQSTSTAAPQYNWSHLYDYTDAFIDCGGYPDCCVTASFPEHDDFTVRVLYFEDPNSCSPDPNYPNKCYRWINTQSLPSGTIVSCAQIEMIYISTMDPAGFIGTCN